MNPTAAAKKYPHPILTEVLLGFKTLIVTIFLWVFGTVPLLANQLTLQSFLSTALHDQKLVNYEKINRYLQQAPTNTWGINRVELRGRQDRGYPLQNRASVKLSFAGWGESTAYRQLAENQKNQWQDRQSAVLNQALNQRYLAAIKFLHLHSTQSLNQKLESIYQDRIAVNQQNQQNIDFQIISLIDAEDALTHLQLELLSVSTAMDSTRQIIKELANTKAFSGFHPVGLPSIKTISEFIALQSRDHAGDITRHQQQIEITVTEQQLTIAQAKNHRYLSYLRASYETEEQEKGKKPQPDSYFFEIGINLPFVIANAPEIRQKQISLIRQKSELNLTTIKYQNRHDVLVSSLNKLINQHNLLASRQAEENTSTVLNKYRNMEGINPLILLKFKESMVKNQLRRQNIHSQILTKYIALLDLHGKLTQRPIANYLSQKREPLQQ